MMCGGGTVGCHSLPGSVSQAFTNPPALKFVLRSKALAGRSKLQDFPGAYSLNIASIPVNLGEPPSMVRFCRGRVPREAFLDMREPLFYNLGDFGEISGKRLRSKRGAWEGP